MFHVYIVDVGAKPVGVIARSLEGYRFYAVEQDYCGLESLVFDSEEAARSAALSLSAGA